MVNIFCIYEQIVNMLPPFFNKKGSNPSFFSHFSSLSQKQFFCDN